MLTVERIKEIAVQIKNLKIRSSAVSSVMTNPNKNEMPVGAKTYVENLVDEMLYDFVTEIDSKYFKKGHAVEALAIKLYNRVFFTNYEKAEKPDSNEFLKTQSCDIDDEANDKIIDIKSPWTKATLPKTKVAAFKSAIKAGYDWQLQSYMSIFKRKFAEVAFCFVETPEELCQWEEQSLHTVNNDIVPEELLITRVQFEFDPIKEAQMFARVKLCRKYAMEYFTLILKDHGINFEEALAA